VAKLIQGRIVEAEVFDPQGANLKRRPLVVISRTSEIATGKQFVGVAITTSFSEPLSEHQVRLPWSRQGVGGTRLTEECVAACNWLCRLTESDICAYKGMVPGKQLCEILERVGKYIRGSAP
jgi:mRNA-degrading endonuclease toxin of MazEF toxin-antitoxin module